MDASTVTEGGMTNGPYIFAKLPVEVRSYVGTPRQCARMRYLDYWRSR